MPMIQRLHEMLPTQQTPEIFSKPSGERYNGNCGIVSRI